MGSCYLQRVRPGTSEVERRVGERRRGEDDLQHDAEHVLAIDEADRQPADVHDDDREHSIPARGTPPHGEYPAGRRRLPDDVSSTVCFFMERFFSARAHDSEGEGPRDKGKQE